MPIRVPLPIKVLLSYLAVLAALGAPVLYWVSEVYPKTLEVEAARELASETQSAATALVGAELDDGRLRLSTRERLETLASLVRKPVVLVGPKGEQLYSSRPSVPVKALLEVHAARGSVVDTVWSKGGVNVVSRPGELGASVLLPAQEGMAVLSISRPVAHIERARASALRFFRNALAFALTVALLLTFVSIILLFRPLRRLQDIAEELSEGDLSPPPMKTTFTEIDETSASLLQLATSVRKRLAEAGSGEAMLIQLVESLTLPLLLFELREDLATERAMTGDGAALLERVVAVNGLGRRAFDIEGPSAQRRCRSLLDDLSFRQTLKIVDDEGVPVLVDTPLDDRAERAHAFVLKRPGATPVFCLLGESRDSAHDPLPRPAEVTTEPLESLFLGAHQEVASMWTEAGVHLQLPVNWPEVTVADAGGRVRRALRRALNGMPEWLEGPGRVTFDVVVKRGAVGLDFDAGIESDVADAVRPLIEPLGGRLEIDNDGEAQLWLPRG